MIVASLPLRDGRPVGSGDWRGVHMHELGMWTCPLCTARLDLDWYPEELGAWVCPLCAEPLQLDEDSPITGWECPWCAVPLVDTWPAAATDDEWVNILRAVCRGCVVTWQPPRLPEPGK